MGVQLLGVGMSKFKNSIIEHCFFKLTLEGTISLEEARKILDLYNGNKEDLLLMLNEMIDAKEIKERPVERKILLIKGF